MSLPSKDQLKTWLAAPASLDDLCARIRQSPTTPLMLNVMRSTLPDLAAIHGVIIQKAVPGRRRLTKHYV